MGLRFRSLWILCWLRFFVCFLKMSMGCVLFLKFCWIFFMVCFKLFMCFVYVLGELLFIFLKFGFWLLIDLVCLFFWCKLDNLFFMVLLRNVMGVVLCGYCCLFKDVLSSVWCNKFFGLVFGRVFVNLVVYSVSIFMLFFDRLLMIVYIFFGVYVVVVLLVLVIWFFLF